MTDEPNSPSSGDAEDTEDGGETRPRDPSQVSIEERWAPISGHRPTRELPQAFRTRWLAAVLSLVAIFVILALLG